MKSTTIKLLMIVVTIISAIIIVGIFFYRPSFQLPKQININTTDQPILGNPNAKIHIVVFEDLKCYNCMRFNVEVLPEIIEKYINTGKAKYTVINVAFIDGSLPAANAARCLYDQDKSFFFQYIKNIYNNQPPEDQDWATIPTLVDLAGDIPGVDKTKLSLCIYKSPYTSFINSNLKLGFKIMNGTIATPSLYINGYKVTPLTIRKVNQTIKELPEK